MFEKNIAVVLNTIKPSDVVLDIGGWAQPFNRANYVIDVFPYETRGWYRKLGRPAYTGPEKEHFSESTWIQRDICDRQPFPFADKSIDYVICSHVLEDIRDPLWVCSEMIRVAKAGYIEVPSRKSESIFCSSSQIAGASHHRWLVFLDQEKLVFEMKWHSIHRKKLHFPEHINAVLKPEDHVTWLFWENSFAFQERELPVSDLAIDESLCRYVEENMDDVTALQRLLWESNKYLTSVKSCLPPSLRQSLKNWYAGHFSPNNQRP